MYKILVVDDEQNIRELVKKYATLSGHVLLEAENGLEAIDMCKSNDIDIVIMDIMMPDLDGFSTVKEIRKFSALPIIMLSARGEEYDRLHGFEIGADDYVIKPFSPRELMMRIDAVMKRTQVSVIHDSHDIFTKDSLVIDFTARTVAINNNVINLSTKEYELLFFLVKNSGIALSREQLLNQVWGYDFFGDERTLDTHIKMLRKSLGEYSSSIVTLRGVGYRFDK